MTMLRSLLVALGAAACLFAFAALDEVPGGPVVRAMIGVALGVAVTSIAYGEATFSAVALGAVSPLALAATDRASLAWGTAAMCALWLAPRLVLAETRRKLVAGGALSIAAASVAGFIFASYIEAPLAPHMAACIFAGSCLSLVGIIVPFATPTGFALSASAAVIEGPIATTLKRAAETHETSRWQARTGDARRTWHSVVRFADQRAALERMPGAAAEKARRDVEVRIETALREIAPSNDLSGTADANATPPASASATSADTAADANFAPASTAPGTNIDETTTPNPDTTTEI